MNEKYPKNKMRPITDALMASQHAIESMVAKNDEENIFDYRDSNPELYKLYMEINEIIGKALEMYND